MGHDNICLSKSTSGFRKIKSPEKTKGLQVTSHAK